MPQPSKVRSLAAAVAMIADGDLVALGGQRGRRHPMAAVREIARQGRRGLHVIAASPDIGVDLLVGAGCIATLETSAPGRGASDRAQNAERGAETGAIRLIQHTEATVLDRFRAAALGLPSLPTGFAVGHDILAGNPHLKAFTDPFTGAPGIAVEAVRPDVAIIHAHAGDASGNVQLQSEQWQDGILDATMARTARIVIVMVEQIVSAETLSGRRAETILHGDDVTCVVEAPYGAHPCGCEGLYDEDIERLRLYHAAAATPTGFASWLADAVLALPDHAAYLDAVGSRVLLDLTTRRAARP